MDMGVWAGRAWLLLAGSGSSMAYVLGVVGLGNSYFSNDIQPFALLATTVTYAILMLLLWLHERFPSRL
jgi:hypothetical protein